MTFVQSISPRLGATMVGLALMTATETACEGVFNRPGRSNSGGFPSAGTDNAADRHLAEKVNISLGDLPSGWQKVGDSFSTPAQLTTQSGCVKPPATLSAATAGHSREFTSNLKSAGPEVGHVASRVTVAASVEANAHNFAVIDSDAYSPCVVATVRNRLILSQAQPLGSMGLIRSGTYHELPVPSLMYEAQAPYVYKNAPRVEYETNVQVSAGRVTAQLVVDRCCADAQSPAWNQMIQRLSIRLAESIQKERAN